MQKAVQLISTPNVNQPLLQIIFQTRLVLPHGPVIRRAVQYISNKRQVQPTSRAALQNRHLVPLGEVMATLSRLPESYLYRRATSLSTETSRRHCEDPTRNRYHTRVRRQSRFRWYRSPGGPWQPRRDHRFVRCFNPPISCLSPLVHQFATQTPV